MLTIGYVQVMGFMHVILHVLNFFTGNYIFIVKQILISVITDKDSCGMKKKQNRGVCQL